MILRKILSFFKFNDKAIIGTVKSGYGRGRKFGAATANLDASLAIGWKEGLYRCEIFWRGRKFKGLLYFGPNSLSGQICLEAHIAGLDENIVGEEIKIIRGDYLRAPKVFANQAELQIQIKEDLRFLN